MGIDYKFDLLLSEDGSGRGAALVAATLKSIEWTVKNQGYQILTFGSIQHETLMWRIEHSRTRIVKMYPRRREHEAIRALPGIAIVLMCQLVGVCLEVGIAWFCYPVFSIHRLPDQHVIYDSFLINFASSSLHSNNFKLISEKPHFILKTTQVLLQPKEFLTKPSECLPAKTLCQ